MNKKGDLSVNVVIIAVLALLVLIVLSMVFMGKIKGFTIVSGSCTDQKGTCYDKSAVENGESCAGDYQKARYDLKCLKPGTNEADENKVCCVSAQ